MMMTMRTCWDPTMTMNRNLLDGATQVPGMPGMFMCSNSTRMGCAVNLKIYFLIKF